MTDALAGTGFSATARTLYPKSPKMWPGSEKFPGQGGRSAISTLGGSNKLFWSIPEEKRSQMLNETVSLLIREL